MDIAKEIRAVIKDIAKSNNVLLFNATVKSVEGDVCTVVYKDIELTDIKLTALKDGSETKLLIIPAQDSDVTVIDTTGELRDCFILKYSEIEEIVVNGGKLGGLINVQDLVDKINACEDKVNDILSTLKTVVIPLAPSGSYPLSTDFATIMSLDNTTVDDIEDPKIKH
jgi:N-acetylmuramic acid 6-phosphate (MurNAc-6-P) etherase